MRDERGFTLIELLVAITLTIIVLTATLDVLDSTAKVSKRANTANDMRENARVAIDRLARDLRNAASPGRPTSIERAGPFELIFDTVDPQGPDGTSAPMRRVRYCLDQGNPKTGRLWEQVQALPNALPTANACPQASYGSQRLLADGVVNAVVPRPGTDSAIFTYDSTEYNQVTSVGATVYVDTDIDRRPAETRLNTTVRLRNRNRAPVASFTATTQGNRHVLLNGGSSSDPEGQSLEYHWFRAPVGTTVWTEVGTGQTLDTQVPPPSPPATAGSWQFRLTVYDFNPGGLSSTSAAQTVLVP